MIKFCKYCGSNKIKTEVTRFQKGFNQETGDPIIEERWNYSCLSCLYESKKDVSLMRPYDWFQGKGKEVVEKNFGLVK